MTPTNPDTLVAQKIVEAPPPAPPTPPVTPEPPRMRWFWPAIAVTVAAVVALSGWAVVQLRPLDDLVDTPSVLSDHDSGIEIQLRERTRAAAPQLDPWAQRALRERADALGSQLDPWAQRALEDRGRASDTALDPWIQRELRELAR